MGEFESRVLEEAMTDPTLYGLPSQAAGLALVATHAMGQRVTVAMDPGALAMARAAHRVDGEAVTVDASLASWVTVEWPESWGGPIPPRGWGCLYAPRWGGGRRG